MFEQYCRFRRRPRALPAERASGHNERAVAVPKSWAGVFGSCLGFRIEAGCGEAAEDTQKWGEAEEGGGGFGGREKLLSSQRNPDTASSGCTLRFVRIRLLHFEDQLVMALLRCQGNPVATQCVLSGFG